MVMTVRLRDALVAMGEGEGKTCKQVLQRVLFEDGQVVDEDDDDLLGTFFW